MNVCKDRESERGDGGSDIEGGGRERERKRNELG